MIDSKKLICPLYNSKIELIYTDSNFIDPILKKFPYLNGIFEEGDVLYGHAIRGIKKINKDIDRYIFYIIFGGSDLNAFTPGMVAHEAFHLSSFILEHKGYIQDYKNEEPQAYLLEYITNECFKFLRKNNIKL